jgi:hypothetical protein
MGFIEGAREVIDNIVGDLVVTVLTLPGNILEGVAEPAEGVRFDD